MKVWKELRRGEEHHYCLSGWRIVCNRHFCREGAIKCKLYQLIIGKKFIQLWSLSHVRVRSIPSESRFVGCCCSMAVTNCQRYLDMVMLFLCFENYKRSNILVIFPSIQNIHAFTTVDLYIKFETNPASFQINCFKFGNVIPECSIWTHRKSWQFKRTWHMKNRPKYSSCSIQTEGHSKSNQMGQWKKVILWHRRAYK